MEKLIDRCRMCKHCRQVKAYPDFSFYGCFCAPYRGKWIVEIAECPQQSVESEREELTRCREIHE